MVGPPTRDGTNVGTNERPPVVWLEEMILDVGDNDIMVGNWE